MLEISISNFLSAKEFVNKCMDIPEKTILHSKDMVYSVDAKSILGVFSLNLEEPVLLETDVKNPEEVFKDFLA